MRKKDLIRYLEAIPGNPEVIVWNGFVEDWQKIAKPEEGHLYKWNKKSLSLFGVNSKEVKPSWECRNRHFTDEELKEAFVSKRVIWLEPVTRNKRTFDRFGPVEY